jgi:hypothetical protein
MLENGVCFFSAFLEKTIKSACSPAPHYINNWHSRNLKKANPREIHDWPIHNANLMYYPLTPNTVLSADDAFYFFSRETAHGSDAPASNYMQAVFKEKEDFNNTSKMNKVAWRHSETLSTDDHQALLEFTQIMKTEMKSILNVAFKTDEYNTKRALWRTCVNAQKVIFIFYCYIDETTQQDEFKQPGGAPCPMNRAPYPLRTKNIALQTLSALMFLTRRSYHHYDRNGASKVSNVHLSKTVKQVYLANKHQRVPIELVEPDKAMATDVAEWLEILPKKSCDRLAYILATTRETATDFFFGNGQK